MVTQEQSQSTGELAFVPRTRVRGIVLALTSTVFFGMAPIFGKLAYRAQVLPFTLVMLRTNQF